MSESLKPDVVASLFTMITRALAVSIEKARTFSQRGFPDEATRRGFVDYVSALTSVLHAHHLTEDDLAFPYFRDKLPDAPFDALTQQHREMVPVLGEIKRMVEAIEESSSLEGRLEDLARALEKINERWHFQVLLIDQAHQLQVECALLRWDVVVRRMVQVEQFTLLLDTELRMVYVNHRTLGLNRVG